MEAEDFLELVWGVTAGWVDLPAKVGGYWVPCSMWYPGECDLAITERIDSCLRDGENLYFSVCQFSRRGRRVEDVVPGGWLWADLDEVDPASGAKVGLLPTVAWRTSAGRYQALWRLNRGVTVGALEKLNMGVTYTLGGDRGGWDLTQVLRVVGTRNYKYRDDGSPMVELLWHKPELSYDPRKVWALVKDVVLAGDEASAAGDHRPGVRRGIPTRAKALLKVGAEEVVEGERSARLWEIECLLAESGWGEDDILEVVESSAWNKWASRRTGRERLRVEIRKAIRHVNRKRDVGVSSRSVGADHRRRTAVPNNGDRPQSEEDDDSANGAVGSSVGAGSSVDPSPFIRYGSFMAMEMEAPRWMIEGLWTAGSHGIIGGEPKTAKTTLALAMGLSVASGVGFMGDEGYAVHTQGPVLMIQEENAPWMIQDRMRKIARTLGILGGRDFTLMKAGKGVVGTGTVQVEFPGDIPFKILNNWGFNLALEEHRAMLEEEVSLYRPVLVVLDPLYMMMPGELERVSEVMPYLKWLMELRYRYDTAVAVVHHMRKAPTNAGGRVGRPGQNLLGSVALHGWVDCGLYCEATDEDSGMFGELGGAEHTRIKVSREFRSQRPQRPLDVAIEMGDPGDLQFSGRIRPWDISGMVVSAVEAEPGITANQLAERFGVTRPTALRWVRGTGAIRIEAGKGRGNMTRLYVETSGS